MNRAEHRNRGERSSERGENEEGKHRDRGKRSSERGEHEEGERSDEMVFFNYKMLLKVTESRDACLNFSVARGLIPRTRYCNNGKHNVNWSKKSATDEGTAVNRYFRCRTQICRMFQQQIILGSKGIRLVVRMY